MRERERERPRRRRQQIGTSSRYHAGSLGAVGLVGFDVRWLGVRFGASRFELL